MAFTFVIWAFALIFLLIAVLFYVFFLFHWIPKSDGGLTGYCERKVNSALLSIVKKKINKAFAKNEAKKIKAEAKAAKMTGEKLQEERAATLPDIGALTDDKQSGMPMLGRADTGSTLPAYQTRPSTPGGIELSSISRAALVRSETNGSDSSYSPNVPLMSAAADMGYGPSQPPIIPPQRPGTAMSQRSQLSGIIPPQRPGTASSQRGPAPGMVPQRPGTAMSQHSQASRPGPGNQYPYGNSPTPRLGVQRPMGPDGGLTIPGTAFGSMPVLGEESARGPATTDGTAQYGLGPSNSQRSAGSYSSSTMSQSLAAGPEHTFRQGAANVAPPQGMQAPPQRQYQAYNPNMRQPGPPAENPYFAEQYGNPIPPPVRSATMGSVPPGGPMYPAQRSLAGPVPVRSATTDPYFQRGPAAQNAPFSPVQRSNTGEEFAKRRWVPPSQRNNPQAYDVEAQYNNGQRYQY